MNGGIIVYVDFSSETTSIQDAGARENVGKLIEFTFTEPAMFIVVCSVN